MYGGDCNFVFAAWTTNSMLEVDVMADRATLLHLLVWYKPLQGYLLMWRQQLDSRAWVAKRTAEVLDRGAQDVPGGFVDVEEVGGRGCMSSCRLLSFPVNSLLNA